MKKKTKLMLAAMAALLVIGLIIINRSLVKKEDERAQKQQLTILLGTEEKVYDYDESVPEYQTFQTQMKRKNGDKFDKEYSGIELRLLLADMDIPVNNDTEVTAVCSDQSEITLTGEEILTVGNIYLVTRDSGEPLDEESGPFMLVVNNDEFSTRWAKNVVKVKISE